MNVKSFLVTFLALVLTTSVLFFIGHTFTIPWLMFHHEYRDFEDGFTISTGSFVPLIIGLIVSFIAEKIHVYRNAQKLG